MSHSSALQLLDLPATSFHSYGHHPVADFDLQSEKCVDALRTKSNVPDTIQIFGFTADAFKE